MITKNDAVLATENAIRFADSSEIEEWLDSSIKEQAARGFYWTTEGLPFSKFKWIDMNRAILRYTDAGYKVNFSETPYGINITISWSND